MAVAENCSGPPISICGRGPLLLPPSSLRKQGPIPQGLSVSRYGRRLSQTTNAGGYGSLLSQGRQRRKLPRPRPRAVDHRYRVRQSIDRDEGAEARAFFLAEQYLIEHVEPVERDTRPAILALLHRVQERLAPADLVDHVLDFLRRRVRRQLRQCIAQILQRDALGIGRLAEFLRRRDKIAIIVDGVADHGVEPGVGLRRDPGTIASDEAPQGGGILRV